MYTQAEAQRVLKNSMTKQLVEWVDSQKKITKNLLCSQFFHKTHSKRDREVICLMLKNFYPGVVIKRTGDDAVLITF
jgi:hypothetical protein